MPVPDQLQDRLARKYRIGRPPGVETFIENLRRSSSSKTHLGRDSSRRGFGHEPSKLTLQTHDSRKHIEDRILRKGSQTHASNFHIAPLSKNGSNVSMKKARRDPQNNTIALGSGLIGPDGAGDDHGSRMVPGDGVYDDPALYHGSESQAALLPFNPNYPKSKYLKSLS